MKIYIYLNLKESYFSCVRWSVSDKEYPHGTITGYGWRLKTAMRDFRRQQVKQRVRQAAGIPEHGKVLVGVVDDGT